MTFFEYAHDSHPYVATAKAVALAMRSLRLLQIVWLFQIVVIFSIVLLAMQSSINFWHATHFCVDKGS